MDEFIDEVPPDDEGSDEAGLFENELTMFWNVALFCDADGSDDGSAAEPNPFSRLEEADAGQDPNTPGVADDVEDVPSLLTVKFIFSRILFVFAL